MHRIPERGRHKKVATRLHQRDPGDIVPLEHFRLLDSQRAVKERIRARVEVFKIARKKDNPEGVAVAPFNLNFFSMDEHGR
jgi:hypothetical protein